MRLKILSYNIHKGFTALNRGAVLEKIRAALRDTQADILFLQEVQGFRHPRHHDGESAWNAQFEFLADTFWTHSAYGKNAVYAQGHHGNAILSRFPIMTWSNVNLSTHGTEPRGMLKATVLVEEAGTELVLANTHLDLGQRARDAEARALVGELHKEERHPWILVGDFNDWNRQVSPLIERELGAREAFKQLHGNYPPTFPAVLPLLSLDRVFLRGPRPLEAHVLRRAPWKHLSDHLPLEVTVELGAA